MARNSGGRSGQVRTLEPVRVAPLSRSNLSRFTGAREALGREREDERLVRARRRFAAPASTLSLMRVDRSHQEASLARPNPTVNALHQM